MACQWEEEGREGRGKRLKHQLVNSGTIYEQVLRKLNVCFILYDGGRQVCRRVTPLGQLS